ncbi:type III secretion system translocon subunit SctE [Xanthomonas albilineans]|uniref:Probable xsa-invasion protein n=1 Tax=Xanthomonas albilineans (strain GPE PC73 / CFBP 7063) TaxID=380358 RepID=D2UDP0_XANAP|nr:type III secretion system translocon subunit SctE [Xanthomonas albilineans]CBA16009.1 probable xsa-invasion protein [Xanthomonas albilineans GPE PC73]
MIYQTMNAIADRALYVPNGDVIALMKSVALEGNTVHPSGKISLHSTQKYTAEAASLAVPQLKTPRAGITLDAGQAESLAEIIKSTSIGDADVSSALKRIGGNVASWEASLSEKVQAHMKAIFAFSVSVGHAQAAVDDCERGAMTSVKMNAAAAALAEAVSNEAACGVCARALPSTPESLGIDVTPLLSATAILTLAMAKLQKLMSKSDIDGLDSQRKTMNELSAARQADLQKSADEYAAKVAQAQRLEKIIGTIAKIGGWAMTIIGLGLALITGGASLLIAAAGVALMAADAIYEKETGKSFIDEAMQPLMDHTIKPMMEWLSKKVTSLLEDCGVPKDKAEIGGAVIAGLVVATVMMTGVVAVGSAAGKVASLVADSVAKEFAECMESTVFRSMKDVMAKLADDNGLKSVVSKVKTFYTEMREQAGLDRLEEGQIRAITTRGRLGLAVGETGLSGSQGVVNVIAANDIKDASIMQAATTRALADKKVIAQILQELATSFSNNLSAMTSLSNTMSDALKNETNADIFVLKNARSV